MKKICILLLSLLVWVSCSTEDANNENTLNGTTWSASYADDSVVLDFSVKDVVFYKADKQSNPKGDLYTGTYSYDGKVVRFDLKGTPWYQWRFKEGVVTGNTMLVKYDEYNYNPNTKEFDEFLWSEEKAFRKMQ